MFLKCVSNIGRIYGPGQTRNECRRISGRFPRDWNVLRRREESPGASLHPLARCPTCLPNDGPRVGVAHQDVVMTPGQLAVIEHARRTPARIVEIERTRRGTAYRNMMKRYSAKAALEATI